jgi:hypothetical protein
MRIFSGDGGADWGPLGDIEFETIEALHNLGETGRIVAIHSADILQATLGELFDALMATQSLGGMSREARGRARRLLRPLGWSASHSLPATARRFAQLPSRFRQVYEEQLSPAPTARKGIDIGRGR